MLRAMDEHCRRCAGEIDAGGFDVVLAGSSGPLAVTSLALHLSTPAVLYLQEPFRPLYEAAPRLLARNGQVGVLPGPRRSPTPFFRRAASAGSFRSPGTRGAEWSRAYDRVLANSHFSRKACFGPTASRRPCATWGWTWSGTATGTSRGNDWSWASERSFPYKRVEVIIEAVARIDGAHGPASSGSATRRDSPTSMDS